MDGGDSESVFKLTHLGQNTFLFQADNPTLAERFVKSDYNAWSNSNFLKFLKIQVDQPNERGNCVDVTRQTNETTIDSVF